MFTIKELKDLRIGDEIDTGALVFEGLSKKECVIFTVSRRSKNVLVEFNLTYFGINIGTWIAQPGGDGRVIWVDQNRSRAEKLAKGKSTGKKKMGGKRPMTKNTGWKK
jgi:hypothetical protein